MICYSLEVKCFRCAKVGHYVNRCTTRRKINELQIDEGLRQTLLKVMLSSSESNSSSDLEECFLNSINSDSEVEEKSVCCNPCKQKDYYKNIREMPGLITLTSERNDQLIESVSNL